MTVRETPLNRTPGWERQIVRLRDTRPGTAIPPLRVPVWGVPSPSTARSAVPAGKVRLAEPPFAAGDSADVPPEWRERISRASRRHGVDKALLAAVLKAESDFDARAVSPKGARGVMQIMPATGKELGLQHFFDPEANLDAGAGYLAALLRRFSRVDLALAAYNAGPDAVRRHGGVPPYAETQAYVSRVLDLYGRYGAWFR